MKPLKTFFAEKTGAGVYLTAFQASSLIAPLFIIGISFFPDLLLLRGFASFICEFGICVLPRWEALLLSLLYRATSGEIVVALVILSAALAAGLIIGRLIRGKEKTARVARILLACLIAGDLIFRLLPLHASRVFGLPAEICAFVFRAGCLALVVWDLVREKVKN